MVSKPLRHTEVRDKSLNGVIIYATIYMFGFRLCPCGRSGSSPLAGAQNADRSWPSALILRIPPPLTTDPGRRSKWGSGAGTGVIISDQRRCFTTAAVLSALAAGQSCTRVSESPDWLSHAVR